MDSIDVNFCFLAGRSLGNVVSILPLNCLDENTSTLLLPCGRGLRMRRNISAIEYIVHSVLSLLRDSAQESMIYRPVQIRTTCIEQTATRRKKL